MFKISLVALLLCYSAPSLNAAYNNKKTRQQGRAEARREKLVEQDCYEKAEAETPKAPVTVYGKNYWKRYFYDEPSLSAWAASFGLADEDAPMSSDEENDTTDGDYNNLDMLNFFPSVRRREQKGQKRTCLKELCNLLRKNG